MRTITILCSTTALRSIRRSMPRHLSRCSSTRNAKLEGVPDAPVDQQWALVAPKGSLGDRLLELVAPLRRKREEEQGQEALVYRVDPGMIGRADFVRTGKARYVVPICECSGKTWAPMCFWAILRRVFRLLGLFRGLWWPFRTMSNGEQRRCSRFFEARRLRVQRRSALGFRGTKSSNGWVGLSMRAGQRL